MGHRRKRNNHNPPSNQQQQQQQQQQQVENQTDSRQENKQLTMADNSGCRRTHCTEDDALDELQDTQPLIRADNRTHLARTLFFIYLRALFPVLRTHHIPTHHYTPGAGSVGVWF
ncbi:uncharacterized protein LOC126573850 [Anopheles aquasalis]|uniref:uncharacterized protein LOC126573850 n=1 Tax=Anopheles aquasalis TaxID=42839 RepID=UPI00215AA5F5|nr:uncharacterized protein LOC126573850 [Anopheles aquasalis]